MSRSALSVLLAVALGGCSFIVDDEISRARQRDAGGLASDAGDGGVDAGCQHCPLTCASVPVADTFPSYGAIHAEDQQILVAYYVAQGSLNQIELHPLSIDGNLGTPSVFPTDAFPNGLALASTGSRWALAWTDGLTPRLFCTTDRDDGGLTIIDGGDLQTPQDVQLAFSADQRLAYAATGSDSQGVALQGFLAGYGAACPPSLEWLPQQTVAQAFPLALSHPDAGDDGFRYAASRGKPPPGNAGGEGVAVLHPNPDGGVDQWIGLVSNEKDQSGAPSVLTGAEDAVISAFESYDPQSSTNGPLSLTRLPLQAPGATPLTPVPISGPAEDWSVARCGPNCVATLSLPMDLSRLSIDFRDDQLNPLGVYDPSIPVDAHASLVHFKLAIAANRVVILEGVSSPSDGGSDVTRVWLCNLPSL